MLPLPSATLLESLNESFGEPELMREAEGNGWRPEKGADKVDAYKGSSLIARGLPSILQLHLKRFTYDAQMDSMNKLNDRLLFPVELNLSSISKSAETSETDSTIYDLQSVVVHVGKYGMGHYYSYVRPDPKSDVWYRFNDDVVEQVTEKEVFEDAYGGRNVFNTGTTAAQNKRGISVLARLLRRIGGSGGASYGFGGSESNAYVLQYVRRIDLHKLYLH
jgi:ubiquitin carboxyl-terminal hydrolase 7